MANEPSLKEQNRRQAAHSNHLLVRDFVFGVQLIVSAISRRKAGFHALCRRIHAVYLFAAR